MIGSESIGFSGSQFRFVVETLNNAAGELALGPEPVQQQRSVPPQLTSHFLHGLNPRLHRPGTPSVQELARPIGRSVRPEQLTPGPARADGPAVGPGAQFRLNRRFAGVFHPAHRAVHKRFEILHAIQDSLDVHPALLSLLDTCSHL